MFAFSCRCSLPAIALVAGIAGCAGGQSAAGLIPAAAAPVQSDGVSPLLHTPLMFTANRDGGPSGSGGLLAFELRANGDVAPIRNISGPKTQLGNPDSLAFDGSGNVYTADDGGTQVYVFSSKANGDVAPARTISGPKTRISGTEGLFVDPSGNLWVSSYRANKITEYAPNANGNVAPINEIRGSSTQLNGPCGMAMDGKGNLYVANVYGYSITVYAKGARGDAAPAGVIEGTNTSLNWPFAIAFDRSGRLLVANESSTALVFADGARGNVAPVQDITSVASAGGVMADNSNHIYVADATKSTIKEFASDADGKATPLRIISGPKTELKTPYYLGAQ